MKVQFLVCEYMQKTYGKKWEEKELMSVPAITNAFISGYRVKENEDRTATIAIFNQKVIDKMDAERESIEKVFGLEVIVEKFVPEHLIVICDDEMNVLSFIDLNKKV